MRTTAGGSKLSIHPTPDLGPTAILEGLNEPSNGSSLTGMAYRRGTRCIGGDCVEVDVEDGLDYRKSERSGPYSDNCVETATCPQGEIHMRDSKDRSGPVLVFTPDAWSAFLDGIKAGKLDHSTV